MVLEIPGVGKNLREYVSYYLESFPSELMLCCRGH
jgi:hypothetical protein